MAAAYRRMSRNYPIDWKHAAIALQPSTWATAPLKCGKKRRIAIVCPLVTGPYRVGASDRHCATFYPKKLQRLFMSMDALLP